MSNGEKDDLNYGSYIVLDGKRRELRHHPSDFSVDASWLEVQSLLADVPKDRVRQLSIGMSRVAAEPVNIDAAMNVVRARNVAHHIYELADTHEELVIADRVFLRLREVDATDLQAAIEQYKLVFAILIENKLILEKQIGNRYTFKVTSESGRNPLKIANEIAARDGVDACVPEILLAIQFGGLCGGPGMGVPSAIEGHALFQSQWYLSTSNVSNTPLDSSASINVVAAWEKAGFGKPDIVIAVLDDGFDLPKGAKASRRHPAFKGTIVDTEHMKNFNLDVRDDDDLEIGPSKNIVSRGKDFHGTCVASIIAASETAMLGVAPCCTFLPIRLGAIANLKPCVLLNVLKEISPFADVVNCSFAMTPQSYSLDNLDHEFLPGIAALLESGGRRSGNKGLIIVFAAGNGNAPIFRTGAENKNGVTIVNNDTITRSPLTIGPNQPVHCGYGEIKGVVVVGAMTSTKRKAGYSNWGKEVTVVAPSDNGNELAELHLRRTDPAFPIRFPGLGIVSAVNRTDHGSVAEAQHPILNFPVPSPSGPLPNPYTKTFGGTSAAAAIVSGVIGLMLSANGELTRDQVIKILMETAERGRMNEAKLVDHPEDPNLTGVSGAFGTDNRSLFFGAGKIDALAAVEAALNT